MYRSDRGWIIIQREVASVCSVLLSLVVRPDMDTYLSGSRIREEPLTASRTVEKTKAGRLPVG